MSIKEKDYLGQYWVACGCGEAGPTKEIPPYIRDKIQ